MYSITVLLLTKSKSDLKFQVCFSKVSIGGLKKWLLIFMLLMHLL